MKRTFAAANLESSDSDAEEAARIGALFHPSDAAGHPPVSASSVSPVDYTKQSYDSEVERVEAPIAAAEASGSASSIGQASSSILEGSSFGEVEDKEVEDPVAVSDQRESSDTESTTSIEVSEQYS